MLETPLQASSPRAKRAVMSGIPDIYRRHIIPAREEGRGFFRRELVLTRHHPRAQRGFDTYNGG